MKPSKITHWLIWSNDRNRWWKPDSNGYTDHRANAGRYSFEEAIEIVIEANGFGETRWPNETMVPDIVRAKPL